MGIKKFKYKLKRSKAGQKGKRVYGAFPSKPGQPPRKQTGRLRASVAYEVVEEGESIIARVGTNVEYGRHLELGTRKMKARPWLRRSLRESIPQIQKILRSK